MEDKKSRKELWATSTSKAVAGWLHDLVSGLEFSSPLCLSEEQQACVAFGTLHNPKEPSVEGYGKSLLGALDTENYGKGPPKSESIW